MITLPVASLVILFLFSCGNTTAQQEESQQAGIDAEQVANDWDAAKEAYHEIMSSTFHPAEEGDLEPLKTRHAELAGAAKKWAELPMPEGMKGKGLEALLQKLQAGSEAIGTEVSGGSDEALTASITALHDVFHDIVGLCDH